MERNSRVTSEMKKDEEEFPSLPWRTVKAVTRKRDIGREHFFSSTHLCNSSEWNKTEVHTADVKMTERSQQLFGIGIETRRSREARYVAPELKLWVHWRFSGYYVLWQWWWHQSSFISTKINCKWNVGFIRVMHLRDLGDFPKKWFFVDGKWHTCSSAPIKVTLLIAIP